MKEIVLKYEVEVTKNKHDLIFQMQDVERNGHVNNEKDQEIDHLKMKKKEAGEAPWNEGTSSKPLQRNLEEKPKRKIIQRPSER